MTKIAVATTAAPSRITAQLMSSNQGQYLTVPSSVPRASLQHTEPPWDRRNVLCVKLCTCVGVVFLFCVFTVLIYSILLAKYNDYEPRINNDSLLAALVKPKE